jgi:hypothetical protein
MKLNQVEKSKLLEAIPLIAAYVAFADGHLNDKELNSAKRIANLRRFSGRFEPEIRKYYQQVFENFDTRFTELLARLPEEEDARNQYLESELEEINKIVHNVSPLFGEQLIKTFRSFAEHVAKAEGGFMQIGAIGPKEARAMKLSMFKDIDSL